MFKALLLAVGMLIAFFLVSARAAAPPMGSEDWDIMQAYADWITNARQPGMGMSCCNISDGRPLFDGEWREVEGGWQVLISRRHWVSAPEQPAWVFFPRAHEVAGNPVGLPIAWWAPGQPYCFSPVGGV